ncbi:unnamed protein product [Brachionus calyciflorus]|uniref:Uncharacterized protein n=1 Tax=Brachionus calyciflorus TaxID=104777 RepID=A0A813M9U5_9BILA|nr:unnamed protein product [Brachionus calyciflorus]
MSISTSADAYDYLFKIIIIGDSGVGKSSILLRYARNEFYRETKPTIGVELATNFMTIDSKRIKTAIWDTAGQERFKAASHLYYRNSLAAFIVYDITNYNSFRNVTKWLTELRENVNGDINVTLVGNKKDIRHLRAVTTEEAKEFAQNENLEFIETSALESENIELAFKNLIEKTYFTLIQKKTETQPNQQRPARVNMIMHSDFTLKEPEKKVECCKLI